MGALERIMIDEARLITGLPERTLQNMAANGMIWGAAKLGRRWTFDTRALRAWVSAQESQAGSLKTSTSAPTAFGMPARLSGAKSIENRYKLAIEQKLLGGARNG